MFTMVPTASEASFRGPRGAPTPSLGTNALWLPKCTVYPLQKSRLHHWQLCNLYFVVGAKEVRQYEHILTLTA